MYPIVSVNTRHKNYKNYRKRVVRNNKEERNVNTKENRPQTRHK